MPTQLQLMAQQILQHMGLGDEPPAPMPRFEDQAQVNAPAPDTSTLQESGIPLPQILKMLLGSQQEPPSGSYTPPQIADLDKRQALLAASRFDPSTQSLYPKVSSAWESAKQDFPFAAAHVPTPPMPAGYGMHSNINMSTNLPEAGGWESDPSKVGPDINFNPSMEQADPKDIYAALLHELSHATQMSNAPSYNDILKRQLPFNYGSRPMEVQGYSISEPMISKGFNQPIKEFNQPMKRKVR